MDKTAGVARQRPATEIGRVRTAQSFQKIVFAGIGKNLSKLFRQHLFVTQDARRYHPDSIATHGPGQGNTIAVNDVASRRNECAA